MWKNFMDFLVAPNWWLLIGAVVAIALVAFGVYWLLRFFANKAKEERKDRASVLGIESVDQLFKIRKIDKEKQVALLSSDPTSEYYWGTGDPTWVKMENFPEEFKMEGKVIKVTKGSNSKIEIVSVQLHRLPTEKENRPLVEARVAKAAALALELAKAKKAT